jgi:methyl-accepting chemotaxis protein
MSSVVTNKKAFWTLGRKLTLVISVTVVIAFAMQLVLQVVEQREGLTTMVSHDFKVMTKMLAERVSGAVRWKKLEAIEKLYQDFTKEGATDLTALVALDGKGASLSAFQLERFADDRLVESLKELARGGANELKSEIVGEQLLIAVPVYAGKDRSTVGILAVSWNLQEIEEGIAKAVTMQFALGATILIGLSVLMLLLINRMVGRPIGAAADVANKIASGNFSSHIDERKSKDELGVLMGSLKTMQANLKESIEADRRQAAESGRIKTALDNVSGNVMVADAEGQVIYLNQAVKAMFRQAEEQVRQAVQGFSVDGLMGCELDHLYESLSHQGTRLSQVASTQNAEFEVGGRTFRVVANPVFSEQGDRLGTAVEWTDRTAEVAVEREVQGIVDSAQGGDLSRRIALEGKAGFFAKLGEGLNALLEVSERVIDDTVRVLSAMVQGNLSETIRADYEGTFDQLKRDANATVAKLTEVIGKIKTGAESVTSGAEEISQGNANLSQRTEEQASSLEETASSMEEMTATVKQNADNARQANQLAAGAREQAEKGGQVVGEAVSAMSEINTSSKQIADIIGVIDEIAFQTNLLALNAAVEAARAGEQGRGFAVVASEVRNLAQRSATAAKQIKGLIQDSVGKVEDGSRLVDESGKTLEGIVTAVKKVSDIVAEIAAASQEQSSGIEQVNKAIMQMDEMTQQNAALVEEAAAASEAMNEQARGMKRLMEFFTVDEQSLAATRETGESSQREVGMDFGSARSKHLMWKSRLRRFLDGQETMSKDQAVSHKHCDLGKWLYSEGLTQYGHIQEMKKLEQVHKTLHEVIRGIVALKHAGKSEQAEQEFKKVEPISGQIVSLLDAVEQHATQDDAVSQAASVERRSTNRPWTNQQVSEQPKPAVKKSDTGTYDSEWEEF